MRCVPGVFVDDELIVIVEGNDSQIKSKFVDIECS